MYFYLDASALAKRYVVEPGQAIVDELCDHVDFRRLYLSYWTITESISVIVRKRNLGDLSTRDMSTAAGRLLAETARMQQMPINDSDARASIRYILRHSLNATDALHLFVALRIDDSVDNPVVMVSADSRLLRASKAEGLTVLDPENRSPTDVRRLLQLTDGGRV